MRNLTWCASLLGIALLLCMSIGSANAQASRTWVSGVGDDANPCSRTAPCKTFAGAISKTAAGGEISTLDPGGFGAVTVTKSISITNDGAGEAGILASSTNGVIINAGANDVVKLKGLVIDGGPPSLPGLNGIRFLAGAALHVEDCVIKNFTGAAPNGNGIVFAPSAGGAELFVSNTSIITNTSAGGGTGILIQPTGSGNGSATISKVHVEKNRQGIRADTTTTTGVVNIAISNSVVAGATVSAISAATKTSGQTPAAIMIQSVNLVNNSGAAIIVNGPAALVRIGSSTVSGNTTAVTIANGGSVLSYQNNQIDGNAVNSTPLPQVNLN